MIRYFGFRRLLPIAFTVLHLLLVLYAATHQPHVVGLHSKVFYRAADYQEGPSIRTELIEPAPLSLVMKLAIVIDLPAFIASVPIAAFLFRESEMSLLYVSTFFVPLLWYGIGRWLDGVLGYRIRPAGEPGSWSALWAALSAIFLCIGIAAITPVNHHRTPDTYWIGTALSLWSTLFLVIAASRFVHRSPR
jgi:hypothetical protein